MIDIDINQIENLYYTEKKSASAGRCSLSNLQVYNILQKAGAL